MKKNLINWIKQHKGILIFTMVYLFIAIGIVTFVKNDSFLYTRTVARVDSQKKTGKYVQKSQNQKKEKYYTQTIKATILNGEYKDKTITIRNNYSKSRVKTDKYIKDDEIFVSVNDKGRELTGTVTGLKRDTAGAIVIVLFVYSMLVVAGGKGLLFLISSAINVALLYEALDLYAKGTNILTLCYILVVLFTVISMLCISGIRKATWISIVSVLIVVVFTGVLYRVVLLNTSSPDYIMMEYVTSPNDLNDLFFMEILMGCLGAVMDVAVSVSETACELIKKNKELPVSDFKKSMRALGQDVTGTMVNILFYSYFCGTVPMMIIQMKNKYKFNYIIRFDLPFEMLRFLTGSIGIIVTIPVTAFVAWLVLYWLRAKKTGGETK